MTAEEIATTSLQDIASMAVRCTPCGYRGRVTDAVSLGTRFFRASPTSQEVTIALCAECLNEELRHSSYDILTPVVQPVSVRMAREAIKAIEGLRP